MDTQASFRNHVREELQQVSAELEKLRAKAQQPARPSETRFERYLDVLDAKCAIVRETLEQLGDAGSQSLADVKSGLKETKQRLVIAKKAAQARFH